MNQIKTVCVYCGSGSGSNPRFVEAAIALGKVFAENNIRLVYGGGSVGLMGAVAKSVLDHGGTVTGIIPDFLANRERMNPNLTELVVTPDMHERKRLMFERSDAFVALPGGVGTLEELVEQMTWQQLGRHTKPVLLANIDNFWEPLIALLTHMRATRVHPPCPGRRGAEGRTRRGHPAAPARRRSPCARGHPGDGAGRRATAVAASRRHSLGNVTASMRLPSGSIDERRVVFHAVVRTQARRTVGAAAGAKRRGVKGIDRIGGSRAKADVHAALRRDRRHAGAQIDPEFGIGLAEADGRGARHQPRQAERAPGSLHRSARRVRDRLTPTET